MAEEIVITAFRAPDLRRLHVLLACYESPYSLPSEWRQRLADEAAHERLRRDIAFVLEHTACGDRGKL